MMAQARCSLLPMWITQVEFWAPGSGLNPGCWRTNHPMGVYFLSHHPPVSIFSLSLPLHFINFFFLERKMPTPDISFLRYSAWEKSKRQISGWATQGLFLQLLWQLPSTHYFSLSHQEVGASHLYFVCEDRNSKKLRSLLLKCQGIDGQIQDLAGWLQNTSS